MAHSFSYSLVLMVWSFISMYKDYPIGFTNFSNITYQSLVAVIVIKLQNSLVEIMLLHGCSPWGLLDVCRASFLENTSGGLLLNTQITGFYKFSSFIISISLY